MRRAHTASSPSFPLAERPDQIFATARSKGVNPGLSRGQALRPSLRGPAARRRRRSPGDFPAASGTRSGRRERRTTTPQASPATEAEAAESEPGCNAASEVKGPAGSSGSCGCAASPGRLGSSARQGDRVEQAAPWLSGHGRTGRWSRWPKRRRGGAGCVTDGLGRRCRGAQAGGRRVSLHRDSA